MSQPPSTSPGARRHGAPVALALAAAACGALAVAWMTSAGAAASPDCGCGAPLRREVAALRLELEQLRFAVQLAGATGPTTPPAAAAASLPAAAAPPATPGPVDAPRSTAVGPQAEGPSQGERFETPTSAVTVRRGSSGDLVVRNADPALTGQTIEVRAHGPGAAPVVLQVVVPPVEAR
jgi:hypothetical protein